MANNSVSANGIPVQSCGPSSPASAAEKYTVLLIAILTGFLTQFDLSAVMIALPSMAYEFHMDAVTLSWVTIGYSLAAVSLLLTVGKIADIYGRKRVYQYGIVLFTLASLFLMVVPDARLLIAVRILQGCGAAMLFGTALSIISSVFPPGERGSILGIYIASASVGLTAGPFLGGILTEHLGWRSIFLVNLPIGIIAITLILWKLKGEWAECAGQRLDIGGSVLSICSVVLLITGLSQVPDPAAFLLLCAGCATATVFVLHELRVPVPVLDVRLFFNNRIFLFSSLATLIYSTATFAVTFLLSLDLQYTGGLPPASAGLILIIMPLAIVLVTPVAGRVSDIIEPRIIATLGLVLISGGLFGLIFLSRTTSVPYILVCLALIGIGSGLFASPNINAIMGSVDKRYYGVANAINGTVRLGGQALSMAAVAMIFALVIGRVEITPEYYPQFMTSLHAAFGLFTALCLVAIGVSLMRGKSQGIPCGNAGPAPSSTVKDR